MNNPPPQETHWRDRAIAVSEVISDGFEVVKAYGARIAEWVLFFCLFANILEMFPLPFPSWFGTVVLAIQAVTLDIAGFGLATMAEHARRRGDEAAANTGKRMGWTLILLMIITVTLITMSLLIPATKGFVEMSDKVLILARVIVTVFYGHIVHSLRHAGTEHENRVAELTQEMADMQKQLNAKQQEVSTVQSQVSSVQKQLSSVQQQLDDEREKVSSVQHKLDLAQQRVSSLEQELESGHGDTAGLRRELNEAKQEVESLRGRLHARTREIEDMQADQAGVVALRRELNAAKLDADTWRTQLDAKTRELSSVQSQVSSLKRELSTVQSQVSSGKGTAVSSGHEKKLDAGSDKVVQLDSRRDKTGRGDQSLARQIQRLLLDEPGLSGRAIAGRVGCSPTTANEWKKFFEDGGQLPEAVNEQ